jgi:hypothetical protein
MHGPSAPVAACSAIFLPQIMQHAPHPLLIRGPCIDLVMPRRASHARATRPPWQRQASVTTTMCSYCHPPPPAPAAPPPPPPSIPPCPHISISLLPPTNTPLLMGQSRYVWAIINHKILKSFNTHVISRCPGHKCFDSRRASGFCLYHSALSLGEANRVHGSGLHHKFESDFLAHRQACKQPPLS